MKKVSILVWMLVFLMIMVACSKNEEQKTNEQKKNNEEVVQEEEGSSIYPFTGIRTNEEVTDRAIAVMVNNHPKARPQSGLSKADIVFEMLTEGDITRFLALYQSNAPEVVGPVRSAREYYFTLADNYGAIYVYHGAANFINDMIQSRGIENLPGAIYDNDKHLFVRESFRKAPHNSYFQFGAAYEVAGENGYNIEWEYEPLPFLEEDATIVGQDANRIKINYSATSFVDFVYDETTEKYTRFNDGEQTVELNSEVPIEVDNVFIVETEHRVIDEQKRRFIDLESGGLAYLVQRGKVQEVEWENQDGRIIPIKDGQVIPFVPGQTWVNFVPSTPSQGVEKQVELLNVEQLNEE